MVAGAPVMVFRRALLRRIRGTPLTRALDATTRDATLPDAVLCARSFAALAEKDGRASREAALQRLNEVSQRPWRLHAAVERAEQSLPLDKGKRFYNRRVMEALEQSDYNRAWGVVQTLHQRHPDKVMLYPYTYNMLLRHLCTLQKTLSNANLTRILALLDVMAAHGSADQTSFQVAMAACSRARDLSSAKHVLEKMKEYGRAPDARIYGFLINCCARKQGLVKTAERYFAEMLSAGVKPTVIAVNAMLRVMSRDTERSYEMTEIVQRAREEFDVRPNTVTTRTVVYYLLCEGDVSGAVELLRSVESEFDLSGEEARKLPVRRQVVNALVDACRQRGEWSSAEYVLTLLARTGEDEHATDIAKDIRDSNALEQLIGKRDAFSAPVAWALDDLDWSRMTRPQQEAFFLSHSRKQSLERALERMQVSKARSKTDQFMERMSLKLDGKLRVLDEMIEAESADVSDFNAVLSLCGRQGELVDAMRVLSKMKLYAKTAPECEPTTWSYNALLNACAVRGDVRQIESIVNEMMKSELQPDQVTMNTVIKAHDVKLKLSVGGSAQTRLDTVMQALSFFEWCTEDYKLDPGAATYFILFHLFSTYLEQPDESLYSVKNELQNGVGDDAELDEGQEEELMTWMTEFITTTCRDAPLSSLDVRVFNNAFDYYQRLGAVDESFALFNLMKKRGIKPDDATLGLMFATCASQQEFDVGLSFLDHLMAADGYKPSLKVLNGAMQLCANAKNPDGALDLFRAIETSGVFKPTIETYEPVVYAYARVGNVARAWDMANEMKEKLGRVTVGIYDRIVLACAEASLPGRALEALSVMQHTPGLNPTVISYNTVLEAFVRAGERAAWWRKNKMNWEAEDEDTEYDDDANDEDFNGDPGDLEERVPNGKGSEEEHTTEPSEEAPTRDYESEQREKAAWARACIMELLEEMQRSGVKPDMTTYERAIAVCSVNEDYEGVLAIFDRLVHRKRGKEDVVLKSDRVSASSFSAYLAACRSLKHIDRVVEGPALLHDWHKATGLAPPVFVVTQLLDALEGVGEWRRAVRILPEMRALFGAPPSVEVFNRVMHVCNREGEHHLVPQIFATMQDAAAYRVYPNSESYIQLIYSEEQRENWVAATDRFVEMRKKCPSEEISHSQLQKITIGRYSLRQSAQ